MIIEIDLTREVISFTTFLFSFMVGLMLYWSFFKCECGALWHTKEERNKTIIYIIAIIIVSVIMGIFQYKLNFLGIN